MAAVSLRTLPAESGIAAVTTGQGPSVVLVHGAVGDYRQWEPVAAELQASYSAIAVSRRHHWPNPPPPAGAVYTYESHSRDLLLVLRAVDGAVHLVGHSWGAGVCLLAALREPKRLRSLTLIEPPFASLLPKTAQGLEPERVARGEMLAAVRAFVRIGKAERAAEALIDWVQGGPGGFASLSPAARDILLANAQTLGPTFATAAPEVTCDQLRGLRVATLVVTGERTRTWFRLIADAVAACVPRAESVVVPAARHMNIVEQPRAVAEVMRAFLARH